MTYFRTPLDESVDWLSLAMQWPWNSIYLIVLAALLGVALILMITRRALRDMSKAAKQVMDELNATPNYAAPAQNWLTTVGHGAIAWKAGGFVLRLHRRLPPTSSEDELIRSSDAAMLTLTGGLEGCGVDIRDVAEHSGWPADGLLEVSVAVRNSDLLPKIAEAALAAGFTEDLASGREEITIEDAEQAAGQRAFDAAMSNATILSRSLSIPMADLQMVGADLDHVAAEAGVIARIARTRWSRPTGAGISV